MLLIEIKWIFIESQKHLRFKFRGHGLKNCKMLESWLCSGRFFSLDFFKRKKEDIFFKKKLIFLS